MKKILILITLLFTGFVAMSNTTLKASTNGNLKYNTTFAKDVNGDVLPDGSGFFIGVLNEQNSAIKTNISERYNELLESYLVFEYNRIYDSDISYYLVDSATIPSWYSDNTIIGVKSGIWVKCGYEIVEKTIQVSCYPEITNKQKYHENGDLFVWRVKYDYNIYVNFDDVNVDDIIDITLHIEFMNQEDIKLFGLDVGSNEPSLFKTELYLSNKKNQSQIINHNDNDEFMITSKDSLTTDVDVYGMSFSFLNGFGLYVNSGNLFHNDGYYINNKNYQWKISGINCILPQVSLSKNIDNYLMSHRIYLDEETSSNSYIMDVTYKYKDIAFYSDDVNNIIDGYFSVDGYKESAIKNITKNPKIINAIAYIVIGIFVLSLLSLLGYILYIIIKGKSFFGSSSPDIKVNTVFQVPRVERDEKEYNNSKNNYKYKNNYYKKNNYDHKNGGNYKK